MNTAYVKIWDETVGAVAWSDVAGYATFEYTPSFVERGWDLAPFHMPLRASQRTFSFPALRQQADATLDTFKGLPGLIADVLPDRYGSALIDAWLDQQQRPRGSMNPVETLCFIGTRGMGALEFEPAVEHEKKRPFAVDIERMVDIARRILTEKQTFRLHMHDDDERAVQEIIRLGTSAGGARPKAVIAYNEKTGEVRSGQTNAPKGFEHWLIKLDGVSNIQLGASTGYGRVEMAYHTMALACGIHMMPCRLLEENGRAHFMTKRFDRDGGSIKHHMQTFCAIKHLDYNHVTSYSYEQLFQTMRELKLPYPEAEQMFRRMVFNVVARNCDDHTKNFAFRMKKDGPWELAPAYDLCHAYQPNHRWVSEHALSINGKRTDITKEDLLAIGKGVSVKKAADIIEEISTIVHRWKSYADDVGVSPKLRNAIAATLVQW